MKSRRGSLLCGEDERKVGSFLLAALGLKVRLLLGLLASVCSGSFCGNTVFLGFP